MVDRALTGSDGYGGYRQRLVETLREKGVRDLAVLRAVASLKPVVDRFFDQVLVMADDPAVRANRLGLMKRVSDLFGDVADFRKVQAELPPAGGVGGSA